jgi:hypothetical protein
VHRLTYQIVNNAGGTVSSADMESTVTATTHEIDVNKTRFPAFVQLASIRTWLRANESTPQKGISVQLGSRSFKNHLSNCGIVATGQMVNAHAMGRLTMTVSGSRRDVQSKELQNADLQFGPLSD